MRITEEDCVEYETPPTMHDFAQFLSAILIEKGGLDAGEDIQELLMNISITYSDWREDVVAEERERDEQDQQLLDDLFEYQQATLVKLTLYK